MTALTNANSNPGAVHLGLKKTQFFTKADFSQLFNNAQKKHGRFFTLYYVQDQAEQASFGTVISKKNAKTSVHRNLTKRLVREHFRLNQQGLKHLKLMLVSKKDIAHAKREDLNQDLAQLFNTLKKLQKSVEHAKL